MSVLPIIGLELFTPLVALFIYLRIQLLRKRRKLEADELAGIDLHPPFTPTAEPAPNLLLRHFSLPQRTYLRQQIGIAKAAGVVYLWAFTAFFTAGLLPAAVNRYGIHQPLAQRVWYSFLATLSTVGTVMGVMVVFAALVVSVGLTLSSSQSAFTLSRPLSKRFLFYGRTIPALLAVLATLLAGLAISFLLLLIFYGPVWLHLKDFPQARLNMSQRWHLELITLSSAPAMFLSLLTTATLIFSVAIALAFQPFRLANKRIGRALSFPVMMIFTIVGLNAYKTLGGAFFDHYARILFIDFRIGTPPPYSYAIIPILLSAALLFIAQFWASRIEL